MARVLANSDSTRATKVLVMPSPEDSVLRAQMEGDGEYAVTGRSGGSRRSVREAIELATPSKASSPTGSTSATATSAYVLRRRPATA